MKPKFANFVELLNHQASTLADRTIFTFLQDWETEIGRLTYQELDQQARAIAAYLQTFNAKGERALLLYQPGLEFISAFFGCLYAGVIAVPAYPPRPNRSLERLHAIISNAEVRFALTTESLLNNISAKFKEEVANEVICLATDNLDPNLTNNWKSPDIKSDQLAFLQYTSGSTGTPKGVMVSHSNLIHNSYLINQGFADVPEGQGVSWLPPYHDMGLIGGILQPVYVGIPQVLLAPVTFLQRPLNWLKAIEKYRGTTNGGPNFAFDLCVNQITPEQRDNLDLSSWELAFSGAEPVRLETIERFSEYFKPCGFRKEAFYPCYGMAETTLIISGGKRGKFPIIKTLDSQKIKQNQVIIVEETNENSYTLVSCGQPIADLEVAIVNPETLTRCSEQEIGEIWVKGDSVTQGYWRRKEQTEETFNAHIKDTQEGPFLRTGDLGFLQDRELFVTGRIKDLIIIRGRNHYPQDIEQTVDQSHPAVRPACGGAFAVEIDGEERLVIVQEIQRSYLRKLDVEEVTNAIRKAVAENHELQPYSIILLKTGTVPKTSSGKVQRHACKAEFLAGNLVSVGEWTHQLSVISHQLSVGEDQKESINVNIPASSNKINQQNTIENWLIENISQRLGIPSHYINRNEPFASYGLDSVQAIRLTADLEDWLGRKLSPTLAYDYPNIQTLAEYLTAETPTIQTTVEHPKVTQEDIAIIGLGCRFPGAKNPQEFWQLLRNGKDAIKPIQDRWQGEDWGGLLDNVDQFDPQFFGISPRETERIDPQQRLLLEVSWEALENAGIVPDEIAGSNTGVFIGISSSDYSQLQLKYGIETDAYSGTGNAHSIAANRLSYFYDLRGPSLSVDTACSSSLVAVHLAVKSLQNGESDQALVGGVNLLLSPELTETFNQAGMMSPDGRCKTFDANADGYVRGEGCGIVILKRLSDAVRNNDNILAVIKGSAINQDGRSNGLTAPNGIAQQAVIRQALANAKVAASDLSYIEAHGTGTSLGDPIEVNSLKAVLNNTNTVIASEAKQSSPVIASEAKQSSNNTINSNAVIASEAKQSQSHSQHPKTCYLGSVKTNIGHLEAAAGIAGLIKIVLALNYGEIPPHLNFQELNPLIDLSDSRFIIPTSITPWKSNHKNRLAGISSFGFGGTNSHVIISDYSQKNMGNQNSKDVTLLCPYVDRKYHILTLSAKTEKALESLVKNYDKFLTENPKVKLADLCFTANTERSHFNHRLAIISESNQQLQQQLQAFSQQQLNEGIFTGITQPVNHNKIAFLFTGQGSQYPEMGLQLYQTQPIFRESLEQCAAILQPYLEVSLLDILYSKSEQYQSLLNQTLYTQPAIFALEYSLAKLWLSWGVKPNSVMGHSVGEYVAACIAGVFSLEDGLKLLVQRAKLMQSLPQQGKMAAIFASEKKLATILESYQESVTIAAYNGSHIVISGKETGVNEIVEKLQSQGIKVKLLNVSHAFHSLLMQPIIAEFEEIAKQINFSIPNIDLISNVTGQKVTSEITTPQYWIDHILQPVQFEASIEVLRKDHYEIFLEVGAKPILLGMGRSIIEAKDHSHSLLWLPSLRTETEDWQQILESLALLEIRGIKLDWKDFERPYQRQRVNNLPTYPFQRQRYWLDIPTPIISHLVSIPNDWLYQIQWIEKPVGVNGRSPLPKNQENWLIFADHNGISASTIMQLTGNYSLVYAGENYQNNGNNYQIDPTNPEHFQRLFRELNQPFDKIIFLWSVVETDLETSLNLGCRSVVNLIQTLVNQDFNPQIWLVTKETVTSYQLPVTREKDISVFQSSLWGLGKAIAIEHPEYWGGMIDLPYQPQEEDINLLLAEISHSDGEDQIAFRNRKRYVSRLVRSEKINPDQNISINPEATYLITGGLGALGLKIARSLVNLGVKSLVLMGRSTPSEKAVKTIEKLTAKGANITTVQGDISNPDDLSNILENITNNLPPLKGIVHAAGVLDDGLLINQTWERFNQVILPKIQGTWNLHQLTQNLDLDFFILFSSAASLLGSPGQSNYSAANSFLDAIAHYRHRLNLPALSINWGAWADAGMASNFNQDQGIQLIPIEKGLQIFNQLLSYQLPQLGVIDINWQNLAQQFPQLVQSPYFQELIDQEDILPTSKNHQIFDQLLAMESEQRGEFISNYLQTSIAKILKIPTEQITLTDSFLDLGMDSLMVMEAMNQVKDELQLMLYPREFYERPRIDALAKYLATEFEKTHGNYQFSHTETSQPILETKSFITRNNVIAREAKQSQTKLKKPVIFILSSPRSGSTLLRVMLEGHPALCSPPELHLLPFATMGQREQELTRSHLGEGLQRAVMELKKVDGETAQNIIDQWVKEDRSIQDIYQQLQDLAGDEILIDKSPTYASSRETLDQAEALFENPKYIHLVRHPYPVIESFCRLRMDKLVGSENTNPYHLAESIWLTCNQNIVQFFEGVDPNRHHLVYYEELVKNPRPVMEKLCQFLEIPFDEAVLDPYQGERMTDGVYQQSMSVGDPNFLTRKQIDPKLADTWQTINLPVALNNVTIQLAEKLNYQLPNETTPVYEMTESFLNIRGLNLCLCQWGSSHNPLILCLHGILEQGAAWLEVAARLAAQGYYVVAPDLRGHGKSDHVGKGGSYNLLDFLGDIDGIVEHLTDKSFTLVGHSLGSVVAAIFSSIRPQKVKDLVLVETVLPSDADQDETVDQLATHLDYLASPPEHPIFPDVKAAADRLRQATPALSEAIAMALAQRITEPCEGGVRWRWASLLRTRAGLEFNGINQQKYLGLLAKITAPITLIYGDKSTFNRPEDLAQQQQAMPKAKRYIIKGGHNLHLDASIALAEIILQEVL